MGTFDLKPMTEDAIQELGLTAHDLWTVLIEEETFGPFDTASLKQYSWDNEDLFETAFAAKMDQEEWTAFFDCMEFPKKSLSAPLEEVIEEKEEETEAVAIEVAKEETALHTTFHSQDLPRAPLELFNQVKANSFHKHTALPDEVAAVLSHDQIEHNPSALKMDEITLTNLKRSDVNVNLLWGAPVAVAILIGLLTGGYYILQPNTNRIADLPQEKVLSDSGLSVTPTRREPAYREPSSVRPYNHTERSGLTQNSYNNNYPTRTEGHDYNNDIDRSDPSDPPQIDDVAMSEPVIEQEPQSLEGAMGGAAPAEAMPSPEVPILESSDF